MIRKKYSSDYKIHQSLDKNGRIKKEAEYTGTKYRFALPKEARLPRAGRLFAAGVLGWAAYLLPLATRNYLSSVIFCILPHVCAAIPLWLFLYSLFQARFGQEPLFREKADKISGRLYYGALATAVLSALAVLGSLAWILFMAHGNFVAGDILFLICDCYLLLLSGVVFYLRDLCKMEAA
ncbi:MAG TPA: hypothetical protein IAB31_01555 [Candidatus Choladousia intestinavium]|uniref:Uncharacterized protein n=1 Tax=Candidatus Choladousia intestinavium TaxID=2840727 RepID=A0A9D1AC08_9FIRM|nr:hypothetical protein [Candidatus Choladousia intestinavium]